jgi:hypothetical protein
VIRIRKIADDLLKRNPLIVVLPAKSAFFNVGVSAWSIAFVLIFGYAFIFIKFNQLSKLRPVYLCFAC